MGSNSMLIFGGAGFVGAHLVKLALQRGWHTVIADQKQPGKSNFSRWRDVDITRQDSVEQIVNDERPQVVINVAALADIDRAERERSLAWQINVLGAKYIAEACSKHKIRHLFFSSDAVFDGERGSYKEEDERRPLNYYGLTKAEAENAVLSIYPEAVVIRVSLVLGFPLFGGNSFLAGLEEKLSAGMSVEPLSDEVRTPIDVLTLAECILELASGSFCGVLHLGCLQSIDRYSLTLLLARQMGYPLDLIVEQSHARIVPGRAQRHKRGILDVSKAQHVLRIPLPDLQATVQKAVSTRGLQVI